jgi:PAS domain S-box-containing protein
MNSPEDPLRLALAEIERLKRENAWLSERLALAQEFGRLGFWERDPETREGRWDEHMFRIFGLEPGPVPHFDEAARRVHPDDRLDGQFQAALKRPGAYAHRYRVMHPDGSVKHVHTQWRVLAGADGRAERVIGVVVDDTEAHEQAQRAQTERLQLGLALSLARIGTWHMPLPQGPLILDEHMWALSGHPPRPEGITLEEVRGWMHPEDLEEARQATERVIANGEPVDTTTRYRHADGRWLTLLTRRVLQRDAQGQPLAVIGVALDVTEQHQRTQQALALARRIDTAAEAANVGLWSSPLDGGAPEWNAQMFKLLGLDPDGGARHLGDSLRDLAHPEDRDRAAALALAWLRGESAADLALAIRVIRPDGSLRWMEVRARREHDGDALPRAFGVMLDVTAQRAALESLREAHERMALALDAAQMGTWSWDGPDGDDDWDERMYRLRGLDPTQPVPNHQERLDLVLLDDQPAILAAFRDSMHSTEPMAYEFRIRRADDGRVRTLASRSVTLTDAQGRVRRRIGVNWDVTEARQLEQAQREAELALRAGQAKAALFARVSHELRTPLNAVLGLTQLLLADDTRLDAAQRRARLLQVQASGKSLLDMVDGVLELGDAALPPAPPAPTPAVASGAQRVLYIEDNEVNMLIVRELLTQRPHLSFHGAPDGETGVEQARELRPALVLIDMQLPGIDGMEVMRQLRADTTTAGCSLIALSANAMPNDARVALAAGFDAYWTKPIDLSKFLEELDTRLPRAL